MTDQPELAFGMEENDIFMVWYSRGRPNPTKLKIILEEMDTYNNVPSISFLRKYIISDSWKKKAAELDESAAVQLRDKMVETRIQMLERHAEIGRRVQEIAFDYIENNQAELTINSAAKLLVDGWKIEKESVDIPTMLRSLRDKSDEQLLKELQQLVEGDVSEMIDIEDEDNILELEDET